jgi:hypothetical protein
MLARTGRLFRGLKAVATHRLSIIPAVTMAYRDVWRALFAMRTLAIIALLIILAIKVVEDFVPRHLWSGFLSGHFLDFAVRAVQSFCLTPFMIAIHRFIILDEITPGYALDPSKPRFIWFFGWLFALSMVGSLAFLLAEILPAIGVSAIPAIALAVIALVVVLIVSMRLAILFPAIAVDARDANASIALADSKGHVFHIFMIFLLALLPWVAIAIAVTLMLGPGVRSPGTPVTIVQLAAGAVIQTITTALCVVIASRVFQALAGRASRQT